MNTKTLTDEQILEKAIQKAIEGGWDEDFDLRKTNWSLDGNRLVAGFSDLAHVPDIIFNHDFAKALWGVFPCIATSGLTNDPNMGDDFISNWRWHLARMVLDEAPIEYLGKNI